jgi:mono/diheme cytochrome c family protein
MRASSALHALYVAGGVAAWALLAATHGVDARQPRRPAAKPSTSVVTPVAGPSWLNHLHITNGSSLGRGAGGYGPASDAHPEPRQHAPFAAGQPVELTGADLYRLNCQACHRQEGTGAPPEVKSLLDLVRGSSLELVRRELFAKSKDTSPTAIRMTADEARKALYLRIREGGQRMPPSAHLDRLDIDVLYAYLSKLAQVPDAPAQSTLGVSWARLGEHVAKGTCHICHDAVGPRPGPDAMLRGAIPPFSVLLADNAQASFITKAREGATVPMGRPSFHYRGRMPVFYYLRDQELAAAYDFLVAYPPQPAALKPQR